MSAILDSGAVVDPPRDKLQAMFRGFRGRCPECGKGAMFRAYLKVNDTCPVCHEELHHQRADDMPPYVTMFIVAHVVVTLLMSFELIWVDAPFWAEAVTFCGVTVVLSLVLLPRVKGALVALQWGLRMHGFGGAEKIDRTAPIV